MDKKPDFRNDLSAIADEVTADVGDMLKALAGQKPKSPPKVVDIATLDVPMSTLNQLPSASATSVRSSGNRIVQRRAPRREQGSTMKPESNYTIPLKNVTTRLSRHTNALLTEAALRQKLKKVSPNTRQEIIETALQEWFRIQGYARGKAENDHDDVDAE